MDSLQAYVTLIKDIITGLSALTAAIVAILGLQAWKKQLKGKTEYELAQRLLRSTYKVREAIAHVRQFAIFEDEEQQAMRDADIDNNLDISEKFAATQQAIYSKRWEKIHEAFVDLDSVLLEAEVIWGQDVHEHLAHLRECIIDLKIAIDIYLQGLSSSNPVQSQDDYIKNRFRMSAVLGGDGKNFFSDEISEAVGEMEMFLKPHLKF